MGKSLSVENIKLVIDALRKKNRTWNELKSLGIPDKSLERILKIYLKEWTLAKKEGDCWVWYEYSRVLSPHNYQLLIKHSQKLLPALRNMLEVAAIERHPLHSFALEHLRFYPAIGEKSERFEKAFNGRVRELLFKYGEKIRTPDQFWVFDPITVKRKGSLGKLGVTETTFRKRDVRYKIAWGEKKPTEEEMEEINELRDLLDNTKAFNERFAIYGDFSKEIQTLIQKVEIGLEPLEGKCSLCPKIRIKEGARRCRGR